MKKILALLMCMSLFLCGCNVLADGETSSEIEQSLPEYYADEETRIRYGGESEFLASDFCDQMKKDGYTVYLLSCDEERYEFQEIVADGSFYKYIFADKETGAELNCGVPRASRVITLC